MKKSLNGIVTLTEPGSIPSKFAWSFQSPKKRQPPAASVQYFHHDRKLQQTGNCAIDQSAKKDRKVRKKIKTNKI